METIKYYLCAVACGLLCVLAFLPLLLIFTEGKDGGITVWNFVGLGWLCILIIVGKFILKKN